MPILLNDLRHAVRTLRKSKGFSAVAVLTMAVGIAANTTVFSWIEPVLLHPYPKTGDPGRLVSLETVAPSGEHLATSYPDFRDLRDASKLLEMMVSAPGAFNVGEGVHADRLWGEMVSGNYFDVLRVKPALGRFFAGEERNDAPGGHLVAIISYSYWQHRFHSSPAVLGSTIRVNRYPFTIIGVAPERFGGSLSSLAFDLWMPAMALPELSNAGNLPLEDRKDRMFLSLARLKPGVTIEQGRAELQSLAARLAELYAGTNHGISATIVPVWLAAYGAQKTMLAPLSILMGICVLVLLIVCANVTNLLLARATTRSKEFSVRSALGAPRVRLVRQLLLETLLLALAGSLLGLVLADQMRASLTWIMPVTTMPTIADMPLLNWRLLLFTEALAVAVTLIAGLVPALHATRLNLSDAMKEGGRGSTGGAHAHRLRGALVVAEVALAVVVLAGAGLFMKSFQVARSISPGFDPRHVAIAEMDLSCAGYDAAKAAIFCRRLRHGLESEPGVRAVSFADTVPLGWVNAGWEDLQIEGYVPGSSENMKIYRGLIAPGYFDLMRIPLVEGRDFTEHDDQTSLPVMIVNQQFVRHFLPRQNPIGRKVNGFGKWFTIVGVARDGKYLSYTESPQPYFYVPIRQVYKPGIKFFVRTAGAPDAAVNMVRQAVAAIDPNVAMFGGETLSEYISAALFGYKIAASMLSGLGLMALLLAAVGIYSVMSYSIVQRTHEIGIRIALGARPLDVTRLALLRGMVLAATGLAIGLSGAAALAHKASAALVNVSPTDPAIYAAVAAFLALIAALASWIPARRAARVDPVECLRAE
jgi:predicted permease